MRVLFAIAGVFGGLGLLAYGIGGAVGAFDAPASGGLIAGGAIALFIGFSIIRALGSDPEETGHIPRSPDPEDMPTTPATLPQGIEAGPHTDTEAHGDIPGARPTIGGTGPQQVGRAVRRIIVFSAVAAILFGGAGGLFSLIGGLFEDDAPNVPLHVLEACNAALLEQEGAGASFGKPYEYEQRFDGDQDISFRTTQGFEWDCRWDVADSLAEVTDTRSPE